MARSNALRQVPPSPKDRPEAPRPLKSLDLTGRERRLRSAMQAMSRVAQHFARSARRTLPFLVKRRSRLAPGAVAFVDLARDKRVAQGPIYEVLLEAADGPAWACLFFNAEALALVLEGALGGAGESATAALGPTLTVAQARLVSKVVQKLTEDLLGAIKSEIAVELNVMVAHSVPTGDEREADFGDGLGVDCTFEGMETPAQISIAMGAGALEAALKERDAADEPNLGDPRMAEALCEVPVEIVAELGRLTLGLRRLLTLEPGQVLRLGTAVDDPAVVRIAGVKKLLGSPVISRGQLAIQIKARHED